LFLRPTTERGPISDILYINNMAYINYDYYAQFFTATILEWKHLLKP